jgi:hypothetical protein
MQSALKSDFDPILFGETINPARQKIVMIYRDLSELFRYNAIFSDEEYLENKNRNNIRSSKSLA